MRFALVALLIAYAAALTAPHGSSTALNIFSARRDAAAPLLLSLRGGSDESSDAADVDAEGAEGEEDAEEDAVEESEALHRKTAVRGGASDDAVDVEDAEDAEAEEDGVELDEEDARATRVRGGASDHAVEDAEDEEAEEDVEEDAVEEREAALRRAAAVRGGSDDAVEDAEEVDVEDAEGEEDAAEDAEAALNVRGGALDDDDDEYDEDDDEEDVYGEGEEDDDEEEDEDDEEALAGAGVAWVTKRLEAAAKAFGCASGLRKAQARAALEQRVEDYNALQKASGAFHRAVLVLPLTAEFDPPRGQPGHGRVQFSDRVSASQSVGRELTKRALEVPWHFELEPLSARSDEELVKHLGYAGASTRSREPVAKGDPARRPRAGDAPGAAIGMLPRLEKAFCSPLDFRAPENFLFCPLWMLRQLRVLPYDVCFLTWVKLSDGVTISLQPHQDAFLKLSNPRSVLEEELKWYSSATRSSTISLTYDGTQYDFDVTDTVGKDGTQFDTYNPQKCAGVAIQDADVSLDLAAHGLDKPPKVQKKVVAEGEDDEEDDDEDGEEEDDEDEE